MAERSGMQLLIAKLGLLLSGGGAAVSDLCRRLTGSRAEAARARLEALARAMEIQTTLNESVEVQLKLIHALLDRMEKRLQVVTIALIATAVIAALALASAWMR